VIALTCPECGNSEYFVQRVVEMWDYSFSAPEDFQCTSAWDGEWQDEVEWGESEFRETWQIIGIFCENCRQLVMSGDSAED
jgi:hypothetical protein